ncbi:MAG TPA: pitrilysin family protein, partial [Thermoanaerobaculia bacterium]
MNALALLLFFAAADVRLPYTLVRLDNGATVVLQQDTSMPQVGVEVWIRGGAREEAPGQHGTAHLFEHDLPASGRFLGNADNRAQRSATSREGGAGTQYDFLRFYATASPDGLEPALGYLADRLESDPAKFSDENVKRDQDIVVSELRRSMNVDWDLEVRNALARGTFGAGHPYGHAIGGSETDVRAANAESMREWHRRFAGAANAIVFIVGNFDPARAEALARHHLGSIPPGRRAPRISEDVPNARTRRETLEKDVPQPLTYIAWPVPGWGTADADRLSLLARVLGDRETRAELELWEMAGALTLRGNDEAKLRQALKRDVTAAELARAKTRLQT